MNKHTPQYAEMVSRLVSGELSRKQAADEYGVNFGTLSSWLIRDKIKTPRVKLVTGAARAAADRANEDPDKVIAMDQAVARVLAGECTAYSAAKADARVNLSTLNVRIRKAREAEGGTKRRAGRPTPANAADAVEAVRLARLALRQAEANLETFLARTE